MQTLQRGLLLFCLGWAVVAGTVFEAETAQAAVRSAHVDTVAVVRTGADTPSMSAMEAELLVRLPQFGFALVERDRLDAILREQGLALTNLVDSASAVQVGRIVAARAMFLLTPVEAGCRVTTGVVLADVVGGAENHEGAWEILRESPDRAATLLRLPPEDRVYLTVPTVLTQMNHRDDHRLAEALGPLLQVSLSRTEGVVVLEREELRRLMDEQLLANVEVKLAASAVLIKGALAPASKPDRVEVALRFVTSGKDAVTHRFESQRSAPQVRDGVLARIVDQLPSLHVAEALPPAVEADRILQHAASLDPWQQVKAAEAAIALQPDASTLSRVIWLYINAARNMNGSIARLNSPMT